MLSYSEFSEILPMKRVLKIYKRPFRVVQDWHLFLIQMRSANLIVGLNCLRFYFFSCFLLWDWVNFLPNCFYYTAVVLYMWTSYCFQGSNVGMTMVVVNVIQDKFSQLKHWQIVIPVSIAQFMCGLIYLTPVSITISFSCLAIINSAKIAGRSTHFKLDRFLWSIVRSTSASCTRIDNFWMDLRCGTFMRGHKIHAKYWDKFLFCCDLEDRFSIVDVHYFGLPNFIFSTNLLQWTRISGQRSR